MALDNIVIGGLCGLRGSLCTSYAAYVHEICLYRN